MPSITITTLKIIQVQARKSKLLVEFDPGQPDRFSAMLEFTRPDRQQPDLVQFTERDLVGLMDILVRGVQQVDQALLDAGINWGALLESDIVDLLRPYNYKRGDS